MSVSASKVLALGIVCTVVPLFAETVVEWDQAAQLASYSNGAVTVAYDGSGNVNKLTLDPETAGNIGFVGGTMTFSPDGADVMTVSEGVSRMGNAVALAGSSESHAQLSFETLVPTQLLAVCVKPTSSLTFLTKNADISHVTNVTARFDKTQSGANGVPCDTVALPLVMSADGKSAYVEFQKYTSSQTLRAVIVGLTQKDGEIKVSSIGYRHLSGEAVKSVLAEEGVASLYADPQTGTVYTKTDYPVSWQEKNLGYAVQNGVNEACFASNVVVCFDEPIPTCKPTVALTNSNQMAYSDLRVGFDSPMTLEINHWEALPENGSVEVGPQGRLFLNTDMNKHPDTNRRTMIGSDRGIPITVQAGGVLDVSSRTYQFSASSSSVTLDGGTLKFQNGAKSYDTGNYICSLTLRNGARVIGNAVRVRNDHVTWKVEGKEPSVFDTGIYAWCANATKTKDTFTIDVDDVTGDARTDFTVTGPMYRSAAGADWCLVNVIKAGAGTMQIDGEFKMGYRPFVISSGTFLVNGSLITATDSLQDDFTLAGGTFAVASGSVNSAGVLTLDASSGLALGAGATLSFADSSAAEWASGALLTVDTDTSETTHLRFGTSSSGLTRLQLKAIRLASAPDRKRAVLDENGYLSFVDKGGLMLILR